MKSLLTNYKSFVRPNLNYADIIYDKTLNQSFKKKIQMAHYQELDLESLAGRRWVRKLIFLHKIVLCLQPSQHKIILLHMVIQEDIQLALQLKSQ